VIQITGGHELRERFNTKPIEISLFTLHEHSIKLFIYNFGFIFDHMLCPRLTFMTKILHLTKITLSRSIDIYKLSKTEIEYVVLIAWN
jgi:hypothetical protein